MQDLKNRLGWQRGNYHDHTFPRTSLRIKLHSGVSICALSLSLSLSLYRWHFLTLKMNEGLHVSMEGNGSPTHPNHKLRLPELWCSLVNIKRSPQRGGRRHRPNDTSKFMISSFLNTFSWLHMWIKSSSCNGFTMPLLWLDIVTNMPQFPSGKNGQLTFSFEGRTYEHQGRTDFWLRGAPMAAGLWHAVVSTQHQQVGQGSLCLLRDANTEVNGLQPHVLRHVNNSAQN